MTLRVKAFLNCAPQAPLLSHAVLVLGTQKLYKIRRDWAPGEDRVGPCVF